MVLARPFFTSCDLLNSFESGRVAEFEEAIRLRIDRANRLLIVVGFQLPLKLGAGLMTEYNI
jgi:hypothetical protein